jgi:hypothetical protein
LAIAARPLSIESRAASSTNAGYEKGPSVIARFGFEPDRTNSRAGSLNGSGRSSAASTMLKTAVLAPMPMAMMATAISVNSRAFSSDRIAYRISLFYAALKDCATASPLWRRPSGLRSNDISLTGG